VGRLVVNFQQITCCISYSVQDGCVVSVNGEMEVMLNDIIAKLTRSYYIVVNCCFVFLTFFCHFCSSVVCCLMCLVEWVSTKLRERRRGRSSVICCCTVDSDVLIVSLRSKPVSGWSSYKSQTHRQIMTSHCE